MNRILPLSSVNFQSRNVSKESRILSAPPRARASQKHVNSLARPVMRVSSMPIMPIAAAERAAGMFVSHSAKFAENDCSISVWA